MRNRVRNGLFTGLNKRLRAAGTWGAPARVAQRAARLRLGRNTASRPSAGR